VSDKTQVTLRLADLEVKDNVRSSMDTKGIDELAASIAEVGLLSPIMVSPNGGDAMIVVAGHRRVEAIRSAVKDGLLKPDFEIAATVVAEATEQAHRTVVQLVENLQREDLPIMDEARGYQALKDQGLNQKQIAQRMSRSEGHISKRLKLLNLPEDVQVLVDKGEIPVEVAIELPGATEAVARDVAKLGRKATVRDVKHRKELAKAAIERDRIRTELADAGITVFGQRWDAQREAPEGKEAHLGTPVSKVSQLPKRIAGVVIDDYATDVELTPVTFKAPSKSQLEDEQRRAKERKRADAAHAKEAKRYQSSLDAFVDNPPAAAELVALLARVYSPSQATRSTFLDTKDDELVNEGLTLEGWQASGEASTLEARKIVANLVVSGIHKVATGWGITDEAIIFGLIDTAEKVGVEFPQFVQDNTLSVLAGIWRRDEAAAELAEEEAVAQAEADAETETETETEAAQEGEEPVDVEESQVDSPPEATEG
jgi:ParB/RepB/Spo0J family partition protein